MRHHISAPRPAATDRPSSQATTGTERPSTPSQRTGHGTSVRAGVGTSTPARTVTGVRGAISVADSSTVSPRTDSESHSRPVPYPTVHPAPGTCPGSRTRISARSIRLFHAGAMTFQKNTDGAAPSSPLTEANALSAPVVEGSSTPGTV